MPRLGQSLTNVVHATSRLGLGRSCSKPFVDDAFVTPALCLAPVPSLFHESVRGTAATISAAPLRGSVVEVSRLKGADTNSWLSCRGWAAPADAAVWWGGRGPKI